MELHDAAAVVFGLKFANNIHYKFESSQASKARLQSSKHACTIQNLTRKLAIQGHVFWSQWKGDKGLINTRDVNKARVLPERERDQWNRVVI